MAIDFMWVETLRNARCLIFDFDGTLVDSNPIKWKAFESCFEGSPDAREKILEFCRGNNHTPRGEKFRHVVEKILGQKFTSPVESSLHARFEALTTEQIVIAPSLPGAETFLRLCQKRFATAVLSSTPQAILMDILTQRGWVDFFRWVQGFPVHKTTWLRELSRCNGWRSGEMVFFGDSPEDLQAAAAVDCRFVGVANEEIKSQADHFIPNFLGIVQSTSGKAVFHGS